MKNLYQLIALGSLLFLASCANGVCGANLPFGDDSAPDFQNDFACRGGEEIQSPDTQGADSSISPDSFSPSISPDVSSLNFSSPEIQGDWQLKRQFVSYKSNGLVETAFGTKYRLAINGNNTVVTQLSYQIDLSQVSPAAVGWLDNAARTELDKTVLSMRCGTASSCFLNGASGAVINLAYDSANKILVMTTTLNDVLLRMELSR